MFFLNSYRGGVVCCDREIKFFLIDNDIILSYLFLGKNKINVNGKGVMGVIWKSIRGDLEMREK